MKSSKINKMLDESDSKPTLKRKANETEARDSTTRSKLSKTDLHDLSGYPQQIEDSKDAKQLTLPDLHGNTIGLLYRLISYGVIELSEEKYQELTDIYLTSPLTKALLKRFEEIVNSASYHPKRYQCIRFIGDIFGDRGLSDALSLLLFSALKTNNINYEITLSNHDLMMINWFFSYKKPDSLTIELIQGQSRSLYTALELIESKIISQEKMRLLVQDAYLPYLKSLNYSIDHSNPPTITLYTHAIVGLEAIKGLCKAFDIEYRDSTAYELGATIEMINSVMTNEMLQSPDSFQERLQKELKQVDKTSRYHLGPVKTPLLYLAWNRDLSLVEGPQSKKYALNVVHGHLGDATNAYSFIHNGIKFRNLDYHNFLGYSDELNEKGTPSLGYPGPLNCHLSADSPVMLTYFQNRDDMSRLMEKYADEPPTPRRSGSK